MKLIITEPIYGQEEVEVDGQVSIDRAAVMASLDAIQAELASVRAKMTAIEEKIMPPHVYEYIQQESRSAIKKLAPLEQGLDDLIKSYL